MPGKDSPTHSMALALVLAIALAPWVLACADDTEDQGGVRDPLGTVETPPEVASASRTGPASPPDETAEPVQAPRPPRARVEHAVFDLGSNRLLAHARIQGALHIDAGSAGFAKYVRFDMAYPHWRLGVVRDRMAVAVAETSSKKSAAIEIPLSPAEADRYDTLVMRVHAPRASRWTIKIGGRERDRSVARVALAEGWQTVRVAIPDGRLQSGENVIAFGPSRAETGIQWLRLERGQTTPAAPESEIDQSDIDQSVSPTRRYRPETHSFVLAEDTGLSYYLYIPESAHLVADVTSAVGPEDECRVELTASAHDVEPVEASLTGVRAVASLEALAGRIARVDLTAAGCPETRLANARLTVPGTLTEGHSGPPPEYIVFWVMDTLRADRVRPFQADAHPEVPVLERLAETGAVFRRYWVQGNESQTSHSSVWTSLYPINHNVRTAGDGGTWRMSRDFEKIPGTLHQAGFYNIGVTANGYVTQHGGYGQDFDTWRNLMREGLAVRNSIPSERIVDMVLGYMEERYQAGRVFTFLGTIDTHKPWIGRQPWLDQLDPEPYDGIHEEAAWPGNLGMVDGSMRCAKLPSERDLKRINAIYDSNVSYQDQQLGRLLERLEGWGIADETMIVVTADHGEELWEAGRCGHGASLRETLVWVPLLIHYPPLFPGRVVAEGTESVDILPTLLDVLDQPEVQAAQGHSLIPLAQGAAGGYPMPSYASQYEYAHAMRVGDWKARVGYSGVPEIYDLGTDPGETTDLVDTRTIERRYLTDVFSFFLVHRDRWKKREHGVASNMSERAACVFEPVIEPAEPTPAEPADPCASAPVAAP